MSHGVDLPFERVPAVLGVAPGMVDREGFVFDFTSNNEAVKS